jgi:galactose mutarotase-like enzyme
VYKGRHHNTQQKKQGTHHFLQNEHVSQTVKADSQKTVDLSGPQLSGRRGASAKQDIKLWHPQQHMQLSMSNQQYKLQLSAGGSHNIEGRRLNSICAIKQGGNEIMG